MRPSAGRHLAALAAFGLLLGGCGNPPEKASFGCPRVGLLDNQSSAAVTARGGDTALATAQLADYDGHCRYDGEEVVVRVAITLELAGESEARGRETSVPYYVAVQNVDGQIVAKRQLDRAVTAPQPGQSRKVTLSLEPQFDLGETPPAAYTILVGLVDGQPPGARSHRENRGDA